MLAAGGCGIGTYNPPPGGARAAGPAKAPPPDAPRAFVFAQPVKAAPPAAEQPADPTLPVGQQCTVHFQRARSAPATDAPSPSISPVSGVLERVTPDWLVVKGSAVTYRIPRGDVLRIDTVNAKQ
jgi:hypothetical protein